VSPITGINNNKYFEIYYKRCQKRKKKCPGFFIIEHVIKSTKTSEIYYLKVSV
jgi:hypothetical protein